MERVALELTGEQAQALLGASRRRGAPRPDPDEADGDERSAADVEDWRQQRDLYGELHPPIAARLATTGERARSGWPSAAPTQETGVVPATTSSRAGRAS